MNTTHLQYKYRIKEKTLLEVAQHPDTKSEESKKALACRRFVLEFINDLKKPVVMCVKHKIEHLKTLTEFYDHLLDQGHTFWYCASMDEEKKRPYYYVQIHRSQNMATCSTCNKLLGLKNQIRTIQKELGLPQWPLRYKTDDLNYHPKISVNNSSDCNPNFQALKSRVH